MSPSEYFWLSLLIKAVLTSTIIVTASLIVERGGAFLGAMIASLPTSVGAAYVVMAVEHSPDFISKSALGSLTANAAGVTFAAVYALLARKYSLIVSLGGALVIWFAGALTLRSFDFTLLWAVALNLRRCRGARSGRPDRLGRQHSRKQPSYSVATISPCAPPPCPAFVIIVTTLSHSIGATASGIFRGIPDRDVEFHRHPA